jgi:pyrroloquinoline quinone (PQQ) biosynthesis protein C
VRAWTAGEELLERLAVLYVLEASQPEISRTKLDGLTEHYGYSAEGPACEYFRVHELRDREHAREARELIELLISRHEDPDRCADRMVSRAGAALRGNWQLLDGVPSREVLIAG